jgi:hypothetical protein
MNKNPVVATQRGFFMTPALCVVLVCSTLEFEVGQHLCVSRLNDSATGVQRRRRRGQACPLLTLPFSMAGEYGLGCVIDGQRVNHKRVYR